MKKDTKTLKPDQGKMASMMCLLKKVHEDHKYGVLTDKETHKIDQAIKAAYSYNACNRTCY